MNLALSHNCNFVSSHLCDLFIFIANVRTQPLELFALLGKGLMGSFVTRPALLPFSLVPLRLGTGGVELDRKIAGCFPYERFISRRRDRELLDHSIQLSLHLFSVAGQAAAEALFDSGKPRCQHEVSR